MTGLVFSTGGHLHLQRPRKMGLPGSDFYGFVSPQGLRKLVRPSTYNLVNHLFEDAKGLTECLC